MRASGLALRIPTMRGERVWSHPRRDPVWEKAKNTCSGLLIVPLVLAWGLLWGLLLLGIVSLGLASTGTEIQISPAPMARSAPDLPVVYELGMIFQDEEDRIYYVL